jgi:hypothetical protein
MWFGLSLFHLFLFFKEKLSHALEKYFQFDGYITDFGLRLIYLIEYFKLETIFKLLILMIYSTAMVYQISEGITNYLKYETITRFEISQKQMNPRVVLHLRPKVIELDKLIDIYPEI